MCLPHSFLFYFIFQRNKILFLHLKLVIDKNGLCLTFAVLQSGAFCRPHHMAHVANEAFNLNWWRECFSLY